MLTSVNFQILEVLDSAKCNEIRVGNVLTGQLNGFGTKVYYTDSNETEWIFYVNDTCKLV